MNSVKVVTFMGETVGLHLKEEAEAERTTKSEQLELTTETRGELNSLMLRVDRMNVTGLVNRLDQVGRSYPLDFFSSKRSGL